MLSAADIARVIGPICVVCSALAAAAVPDSGAATTLPARVLQFPEDRSLGLVNLQDEDFTRERTADKPLWYFSSSGIEAYADAMGTVRIPAGKRVQLYVRPEGYRDLSPLAKLVPDDVYWLQIGRSWQGGPPAKNEALRHVSHLTGLRVLELHETDCSSSGLRHLENMQQLEVLSLPHRMTDRCLPHLLKLKSLRVLYLIDCRMTNDALARLVELPQLEELNISGNRTGIDHEGIAHLVNLPRLKYLGLIGRPGVDEALKHVPKMKRLEFLSLGNGDRYTNAGMAYLAEANQLRHLSLYNVPIDDAGVAALAPLKSLVGLNLGYWGTSRLTGACVKHLAGMPQLESLVLDSPAVTDISMQALSGLSRLRVLNLDMNSSLSDRGVEAISGLTGLEELTISGDGITNVGLDRIGRLKNLEQLNLRFGLEVTDEGLAAIGRLSRLRHLNLRGESKVSTSGLNHLNSLTQLEFFHFGTQRLHARKDVLDLSALTELEQLWFACPLEEEDFANLARLQKLNNLNISGVAVGDESLRHISQLQSMRILSIDGPNLTDACIPYLSRLEVLSSLILGGRFTDQGVHALRECESLRSLRMHTSADISAEAVDRLRTALPQLGFVTVDDYEKLRPFRRPATTE